MALQIAAQFVSLVQSWREAHRSGGKALSHLASFIGSIQKPPHKQTPNILKELLEEVPTEALEKYIQNGSKRGASETGWNTAEAVGASFKELHHTTDICSRISKTLEELVDEMSASYKSSLQKDAPMGNLEDIMYSMVVLFEAIQKEMDVMRRVTEAVQLDTKPSNLRTYCLVWDLEPYLDLNLVEHLSGLIKTGSIQ
ncbi:hypothetical protein BSKO_04532 [Bryopsis sp. KO-2023]|nr:hypothetical protein BSKO_04532 [Bryopsis sp. KO-2023]